MVCRRSLFTVQKSLAGWHITLLLRVPGGPRFPRTWQQNSLVQCRVCQLDGLRRSSLVTFTSLNGVPGLFYVRRSTSRPGSHSFCVSGHQKLSCLQTGLGQSGSCTGREATYSQQGFPESHRAAAWPPAPRFEPHVLPGWRQVGAQPVSPFWYEAPFPRWAGCRGAVAWCCPVSSMVLGSPRPTWRQRPSRTFCQLTGFTSLLWKGVLLWLQVHRAAGRLLWSCSRAWDSPGQ